MATHLEKISIAKYMREYAQLLHAEAEKFDILGVKTTPDLFEKAQQIFFLSDQVHKVEKRGVKLVDFNAGPSAVVPITDSSLDA